MLALKIIAGVGCICLVIYLIMKHAFFVGDILSDIIEAIACED